MKKHLLILIVFVASLWTTPALLMFTIGWGEGIRLLGFVILLMVSPVWYEAYLIICDIEKERNDEIED